MRCHYFAALTAVLTFAACSTSRVTVERFTGQPSSGVTYTLPKTVLNVTLTYSIKRQTFTDYGVQRVKYVGNVSVSGVINPKLVPDTQNTFVIKSSDLSGGLLLDTTQQYTLDDLGMLSSVDNEMTDQTVEVIKGLASTAVEIAKTGMRGAETEPAVDPTAKAMQDKIDELYKGIATAPDPPDTSSSTTDPAAPAAETAPSKENPNIASRGFKVSDQPSVHSAKPGGGAGENASAGGGNAGGNKSNAAQSSAGHGQGGGQLGSGDAANTSQSGGGKGGSSSAMFPDDPFRRHKTDEAMGLRAMLKDYQEDHQYVEDEYQESYVLVLDPRDFVRAPDGFLEYAISPPQLAGKIPASQMPTVIVRLTDKTVPDEAPQTTKSRFDGILYRPARAVETRLLVITDAAPESYTEQLLFTGYISYPQYSPFFTVPIRAKLFASTGTALQFSPVGGGLHSMNVKKGNSGAGAAQAMSAIGGAAADINTASNDARHAATAAQKNSTGGSNGEGSSRNDGGSSTDGKPKTHVGASSKPNSETKKAAASD